MKEFTFDKEKHEYTLDGKLLTGVTSILGVIAKPFLLPWGVKLTAEEVKKRLPELKEAKTAKEVDEILKECKRAHTKARDKAGDKGTIIHEKIEEYVNQCLNENNGEPMEASGNYVEQFAHWARENVSKFVFSEKRLYSEKHWYAGTVDIIYRDKNDKLWIADVKTSNGIYPEMFAQMGGYMIALEEMGDCQDFYGAVILHIDKKNGSIEDVGMNDVQMCKDFFLHANGIYKIKNNIII